MILGKTASRPPPPAKVALTKTRTGSFAFNVTVTSSLSVDRSRGDIVLRLSTVCPHIHSNGAWTWRGTQLLAGCAQLSLPARSPRGPPDPRSRPPASRSGPLPRRWRSGATPAPLGPSPLALRARPGWGRSFAMHLTAGRLGLWEAALTLAPDQTVPF